MGWFFLLFGWIVGVVAGLNALVTLPLIATVQQQTVLWIQLSVTMLGFVLAALGAAIRALELIARQRVQGSSETSAQPAAALPPERVDPLGRRF